VRQAACPDHELAFPRKRRRSGLPLWALRRPDPLRCHTAMDEERNKAVVARFDELGNGTGDLATLDELRDDLAMVQQLGGRPIAPT
jgi:hypothetical protein